MIPRPLMQSVATESALSPEFLHDLRTPLNHILGLSEMLMEQAQEEGQAGLVPDLQTIHAAARQLFALLSHGAISPPDSMLTDNRPTTGDTSDIHRPGTVSARERPGLSPARILVVDDSKVNRDMLARRLARQGYDVHGMDSGHNAMEAMRAQSYDLVLLDMLMPGMDGNAVLKEMKDDETLSHIPVIMLSALDELRSVVRCIKMGAEDYLTKPFEPTLLKARIGACLEKKRAHDHEMVLFQELQRNYGRLQELEKLRDDLTNMIIHDLRTPLSSVIVGLQTLTAGEDLDPIQNEIVEIAVSGGESLLGMINDLLDVEKIESGSMQLDYAVIDAAELIAGAADQVALLSENKKLTLIRQSAANLPVFRGDENKLRRVLVNLLGNAIKFTPFGGAITIAAQPDEGGRGLLFSVCDTGEGIPAEAFEHIFEKFGQVESRQGGRTMSTGLGLTFCKLAVEAHGGTIRVDSMPGQGSTFSFTIPLTTDASVSSVGN